MNRREFIQAAGTAALLPAMGCESISRDKAEASLRIIDCHTHFYDPTRPQGVPWPGKNDSFLYRKIMPADYRAEKVPIPVSGTVVVEASPWLEDNQWILDLAAHEEFIAGFCGNLDPAKESFSAELGRFAVNPLFRGIRVSGGSFKSVMRDSASIGRLGLLAVRGLQLDLNIDVEDLPAVAKLAGEIPSLRIVIDHVANTAIDGKTPASDWSRGMGKAARHSNVFAKVSGFVEGAGRVVKPVPTDTSFYAPWLEMIWTEFGEDRLVYGSNWPVSALFAPLFDVQRIVTEYFQARGNRILSKVFADNARTAYRWAAR